MSRPVCLELCSGEGGSTRGLMDAGWDVIAVDNDLNRLKRNPAFEHYFGDWEDALDFYGADVDAVWAGFPCQGYTAGTRAMRAAGLHHKLPPRLIAVGRARLQELGKPYVLENVEGARSEMRDPITLCGTEFGLTATDDDGTPLEMWRHRLFESDVLLAGNGGCRHHAHSPQVAGVYGGARRDKHEARNVRHGGYVPPSPEVQAELLGIDWMTTKGRYLCIPPVYAEHIGAQLLAHVKAMEAAA